MVCPATALNEILSSTFSAASGYEKSTFLNSTDGTFSGTPFVSSRQRIFDLVFSTALILCADTFALGSITNSIDIIKNDIITCDTYCANAVIFPRYAKSFVSSEIPTHEQSSVVPLKMILIKGFCSSIILSMNIKSFVSTSFVFTNFFFSSASLLNARITLSPVKFSRVSRVILSTSSWNTLNFGITSDIISTTEPSIAAAPTQIIHPISGAVCIAIITEIIQNSGALTIIASIIIITFCTWFTSLVVRVISDAVLKSLRSSRLKLIIFWKISRRISRAKFVPTLAEK